MVVMTKKHLHFLCRLALCHLRVYEFVYFVG